MRVADLQSSTLYELNHRPLGKDKPPLIDGSMFAVRPDLDKWQEWSIEGRIDQSTRVSPDTINPISPYDINPRIPNPNYYGIKHNTYYDPRIYYQGNSLVSGSTHSQFETYPIPKKYSFMGE